ncbi:MAG: Gfo/Idh/MocA family oxidoreductase, partial [Firmicutes bacterium]|nr:Gfo/Idh/MocA family oxidoreductase [Bacillota bacterium]
IENDRLIILLTDRFTASAGDAFADLMLNMENTLIIGQNTAGILLTCMMYTRLSLWRSGVPFGFGATIHIHPEGHLPEGIGIAPDLWVNGDALTAALALLGVYIDGDNYTMVFLGMTLFFLFILSLILIITRRQQTMNVAILGMGRSGRDIHGAYLLTATDKYKIVYVVDPVPERRARAEEEYGCQTFADYKELIGKKDIDLVINATPSHLHYPITMDLLANGFNVLCEKPLAHTAAQVDELIARAKESGKMLAVFHQSRFAPYFRQVNKVLESGVLGRVIQVSIHFSGYARRWDWQCCKEFGGGNLYNTGPHPVDQALQLLNYEGDPNVVCYMDRVNTFGDAEDYVKLLITAPNRPVIDVEVSSCNAYPGFTYNIMGSAGGLKGSVKEMQWRWFVPEEAPMQELVKGPLHDGNWYPRYCSEPLKWHEDKWEVEDDGIFTLGTERLYDSVYDHLKDGTPLVVTPEQVRQMTWVMEESHKQNPLD